MALNLGSRFHDAVHRLHIGSEETKALLQDIRNALHDQTMDKMNHALECDYHARPDAIGYTRALRDVLVAIEAAVHQVTMNKVDKVGPTRRV